MKPSLKAALVGVGVSVLLLLGALLVAPFFLKDRVIELVERQINERLDATVTFEDVDLSLLSSFPTLTIEVVGVEVAGAGLVFPDMRAVVLIKDGEVSLTDVRSDAGSRYAEAILSALKADGIVAPPGSRLRRVLPLKMR